MSHTKKNLRDVTDVAAAQGAQGFEARFATGDLGCENTGVGLETIAPGGRTPFKHRHENAEEVYVVLSGGGRMLLDDEAIEVGPLDAVRVAPQVTRGFEAGDDGLEFLVFGPRHKGDAEIVPHES